MTSTPAAQVRILLVCLGNICRSPTAQGVLEKYIQDRGLENHINVDSAGTGDWHVGSPPDPRAVQAARMRGYAIDQLVARQVTREDFQRFDYILCMDRTNLAALRDVCPPAYQTRVHLLLDFADSNQDTVPDPYYGGRQGFDLVLDLIEQACDGLLQHLQAEHFTDIASRPAKS